MGSYKNYTYVIFLLLGLNYGCVSPSTTVTKVKLNITSKINGVTIISNKFYAFENGDSLMMSDLKFFIQNPTFIDNSNQDIISNELFLYSLTANNTSFSFSNSKLNGVYKKLQILIGLDAATNNTNPTSVGSSNPLNSGTGMYWSEWTKYRYIIFEGLYKKADGTTIPLVYHTGLSYIKSSEFSSSFSLSTASDNVINFSLDMKDILKGNNNSVDFKNTETTSHSTPSEDLITKKIVENFNYALKKD